MKNLLLTLIIAVGLISPTKACQCNAGFFCESIDSQSVIVYGYKIADIDTKGVVMVVLQSWGTPSVADTINIYDDSLFIYHSPYGGEGNIFQCAKNPKLHLNTTDTFLLDVVVNYSGSGFGAPADYLFRHSICTVDLMPIEDGMVRDTHWFYAYPQPNVIATIEEPLSSYVTRLIDSSPDCNPTRVINSVGEMNKMDGMDIWVFNKTLNIVNPNNQAAEVKLYNLVGQQIYYAKTDVSNSHNLSLFSPGVYIAEISINDKSVRKKVIVQ